MIRRILATFLSILIASHAHAASTKLKYETDKIRVSLNSRTPQQMSAFYGARGFQSEMIKQIAKQCFITVYIRNKTPDIVWLELSNWQFSNSDGEVKRLDRNYWKQQWQQMQIPMAHQSTFRWTLIPETLNFLPDEAEGGNIILPRSDKPLTINAEFKTGKDKSGPPLSVTINHILCARD